MEESDEAVFYMQCNGLPNMQCNGLPVRTVKIRFGVVIPLKILYFEMTKDR